jgi:hypothetical protein
MTQPDPNEPYMTMFDLIQPYREMLRGLVAQFVSDGFTDEQARVLVVKLLTTEAPKDDESGESDG